jgi:hypothetical protein
MKEESSKLTLPLLAALAAGFVMGYIFSSNASNSEIKRVRSELDGLNRSENRQLSKQPASGRWVAGSRPTPSPSNSTQASDSKTKTGQS